MSLKAWKIRFHKRQVSFLVVKTVTYKRGISLNNRLNTAHIIKRYNPNSSFYTRVPNF